MNVTSWEPLIACIALLAIAGWPGRAAATAPKVHPVQLASDTSSSTCLNCHSDLTKRKYVHTAVGMGCAVCHSIQNNGNVTQVTMVSPPDQLCFTCHTKSSDPVQHQPYSEGACLVCHSPHASDFPDQTLASHQEICMGCHVYGLPKVNRKKKTVTVPWGATMTWKQVPRLYYIGLNKARTANHPVEGHPVTGPNTLLGKSAPEITCLSCHQAHTSTQPNLRPAKFGNQTDLCVSCHTTL